jgi:hypothetical protein
MPRKPKVKPPIVPTDIELPTDAVPEGCILIPGQFLQQRAKQLGLPYGVARKRVNKFTMMEAGIVILEKDKPAWDGPRPTLDPNRR